MFCLALTVPAILFACRAPKKPSSAAEREDGVLRVELQEGRSDDKLFCGLYSYLTIAPPLFRPTSPIHANLLQSLSAP